MSLCVQVTFLYKLTQGSCPKSYGTNVARLAGLPQALVQRASQVAASLELRAQEETCSQQTDNNAGSKDRTTLFSEPWQESLSEVVSCFKQDGADLKLELVRLQGMAKALLSRA